MAPRTQQELATIVGNNIVTIRQRQGLSQADFAKMMGMGADSLSRIERGFVAPRFGRLEKIAKILGCSVAALFETNENSIQHEVVDMPRDEELLMHVERIMEILKGEPQSSKEITRTAKRPKKTCYAIRARRKHRPFA